MILTKTSNNMVMVIIVQISLPIQDTPATENTKTHNSAQTTTTDPNSNEEFGIRIHNIIIIIEIKMTRDDLCTTIQIEIGHKMKCR